ncbi:MAG: hypothetical protein NZ482_09700, partial [Gloeomargarita sp. SKYG98]|nr:hypothetical protein [Gloeomargarita sp. SKYG98]
LERAQVSWYELKAAQRRLRARQVELTNTSILAEVERRQQALKTVKDRRRRAAVTPKLEPEPPESPADSETPPAAPAPPVRIWNLDDEW